MRYFSGRLIQAGLLLLGASILTFLFSSLAPGSYFDEMRLNPQISPETVAALRAEYQPDRPLPVRYVQWMTSCWQIMTISFLGLGVPEPVPSWGNLLANLQQYSVLVSYWWMYLPAVAIVPFFLGYQGLASALQEHASPYKTEPGSSGGAE
jgi:hypothetical protein